MSEGYLGQIIWFAGGFAPKNWELCNGEILPINGNEALFSILGTTYGGDGRTTFALPDLRGRIPLSPGQGNNLSNYNLGDKSGSETVALTTSQIPSHTHQLKATSLNATQDNPSNNTLAKSSTNIYNSNDANLIMNAVSIGITGGQAHENRQPILAVNYIICVNGIYPSRN